MASKVSLLVEFGEELSIYTAEDMLRVLAKLRKTKQKSLMFDYSNVKTIINLEIRVDEDFYWNPDDLLDDVEAVF